MKYSHVEEFQRDYPTKEEKVEALKNMDDEQIQVFIDTVGIIQGKIFYSKFLKGRDQNVTQERRP